MKNVSRFTRFSWGKISFERFALCKKNWHFATLSIGTYTSESVSDTLTNTFRLSLSLAFIGIGRWNGLYHVLYIFHERYDQKFSKSWSGEMDEMGDNGWKWVNGEHGWKLIKVDKIETIGWMWMKINEVDEMDLIIVHHIWASLSYYFQSFGCLGLVFCSSFIVAIWFDGIQFKICELNPCCGIYFSQIKDSNILKYINLNNFVLSFYNFVVKISCLSSAKCFAFTTFQSKKSYPMYIMYL